jgi:hypothetical protein
MSRVNAPGPALFRSLRNQYLFGSLVVFAATLGLLSWNALRLVSEASEERFEAEQQAFAPLLVAAVGPLLASRDYATLNDLVRESDTSSRVRCPASVMSRTRSLSVA